MSELKQILTDIRRCAKDMKKELEAQKGSESSVDRLVIPKGVVAVLVASDGREIANATDFNSGFPGGFSQQEAQKTRARRMLSLKTMRELASPLLSKSINEYDAERILQHMCENGCRVIVVPIGYSDEEV